MDDVTCHHCGSTKDTWFDRTLDADGNMCDRCSDCGMNVDEKVEPVPPTEPVNFIRAWAEAERIIKEYPKLVQPNETTYNLAKAYMALNDKLKHIASVVNKEIS